MKNNLKIITRSLVLGLIVVLSTLSFNAKASHYMGGEITWECLTTGTNAGKYIFTMKVYRECGGMQFGNAQTLTTNSPAGSISMTEIPGWPKDISPRCDSVMGVSGPGLSITCAGATASNTGAIEEHIYRSGPIQLNGVPPAGGWIFSWGTCCRNPSSNVPGTPGWKLRAIMYPYGTLNAFPCYDNSPVFAEVSRSVICKGYPFTYNHNAWDKELDSLHFEWGQPLVTLGTPLTYGAGYSYTSPLPGTAQNPNNVPAVVNPHNGTISFTSYTTGAFVTSTKVSAYKCGVLVAEIWRDMQVVLLGCGTNSPPNVTPPFGNGTLFTDTVFAEETVCFNLSATDFQFLPNQVPQTMEIEASGSQLGAFVPASGGNPPTLNPNAGCVNPPCAVLTPAPDPSAPLTGVFGVQTQFCWQTDCDHLATTVGCGNTSNVYTFVLKVSDNFCPAPSTNISTVTIVVLPKPTLPAPEMQCMKVQPNGDVEISWTPVVDTINSFDSYRIYSSTTQAGPYVEIDSIFDINQTSYYHSGANANSGIVYYTMKTLAGCPGHQLLSDSSVASTMHLTAVNPSNGTASLSWNATHTPLLATSTGWYHIYREYPIGVWELIDSTMNTSYIDTITVCGDTVSYRIELTDTAMYDSTGFQYSCNSVSSLDNDYFADIVSPNIPNPDSVSVNPLTGFVEMSWDINTWKDTDGYIIYLYSNGAYTPVDTVWGDSTINYIDQTNPACGAGGSYNQYTVAAIDSCGNTSPMSLPHNTINLTAVKDICDDKITLSWNAYNNMISGVASYDIYVSENNGPVTLLNSNLPIDTTFIHNGLTDGSTYCYIINAQDVSGTRSSSSCAVCEVANKPSQPKFVYIRTATVLAENNGVLIKIHTDTSAKVSQYRLERYDASSAAWNAIASIPPDYNNPTVSYTDGTALVRQQSYRYRATVVDSCGIDVMTSDVAKTILLNVEALNDLTNELVWNKYEGFSGGVVSYDVYRSTDGIWDPMPIINVGQGTTAYIDDVQGEAYTSGSFDYFVNAIEGLGNVYTGESDTSRSNTVVALQQPKLYVPSGFNPESSESKNRIFMPVGVFINSMDYLFIVYDRWGEKLYETNVINEGWDGTFKGTPALQGVYTYFVKFTTSDGREFEKRGTVTLIR